jgi:hypothetical protein
MGLLSGLSDALGIGEGSVLSLGSTLTGLVGGKDKVRPEIRQSGFATLPQEVKDAWLKTALPDMLKNYNTPYRPVPMKRVNAPQSPFDSQAMYELQEYSDRQGGLFTPSVLDNGTSIGGSQPTTSQDNGASQDAIDNLRLEMLGRQMVADAAKDPTQRNSLAGWTARAEGGTQGVTPEQYAALAKYSQLEPQKQQTASLDWEQGNLDPSIAKIFELRRLVQRGY